MLEFIENIDYKTYSTGSGDYDIIEQLEELQQLLKYELDDQIFAIYRQIRNFIYKEIKLQDLAVCRILNDIHYIRKKSSKAAEIIAFFVANNHLSYADIAREFGCSKQNIDQFIKNYCKEFQWLEALVACKGEEDSKNENNRQIFFKRKPKESKTAFIWEEDFPEAP